MLFHMKTRACLKFLSMLADAIFSYTIQPKQIRKPHPRGLWEIPLTCLGSLKVCNPGRLEDLLILRLYIRTHPVCKNSEAYLEPIRTSAM